MLALTGYKLAHYMTSRLGNEVKPDEVVAGKWLFIDQPFANARNANFLALKIKAGAKNHEQGGYFFKQPLVINALFDSLYNEALFYERVGERVNDIKKHLLPIKHYDVENKILILQYFRRSKQFADLLAHLPNPRNPKFSSIRVDETRRLAQMLRVFNEALSMDKLNVKPPAQPGLDKICLGNSLEKDNCFRVFIPWILTLTDNELIRFNESSMDTVKQFARFLYGKDPDARQVISQRTDGNKAFREIERTKRLLETIKKLRATWRVTHLINADAHLSNIVVDEHNNFYFADWEYTSWGDPRWDFAGILSSYLSFLRAESPVLSVDETRRHVQVLFHTYFPASSPAETYKICFQYAGLWLLTEFYAWAISEVPSGDSIYQDKFRMGKLCLLDPKKLIEYFDL